MVFCLLSISSAQEFRVVGGTQAISEATLIEVRRMAEASSEHLLRLLPGAPSRHFTITVHGNRDSVPPEVRKYFHDGTGGLALLLREQIHILLQEVIRLPPNDLRTVVEHELVHIYLEHFAGDAARWVPRWFHEGLAQHLSGGPYLVSSEKDIYTRARAKRLLQFSELREGFPDEPRLLSLAYAQSFSFVSFLAREIGLDSVIAAVKHSDEQDWYRSGLLKVTGMPMIELEERWRNYILDESGVGPAWWRDHCFSLLMIPGTILLILAVGRVLRREQKKAAQLQLLDQDLLESGEKTAQDG